MIAMDFRAIKQNIKRKTVIKKAESSELVTANDFI
jgi:hypothetical protein